MKIQNQREIETRQNNRNIYRDKGGEQCKRIPRVSKSTIISPYLCIGNTITALYLTIHTAIDGTLGSMSRYLHYVHIVTLNSGLISYSEGLGENIKYGQINSRALSMTLYTQSKRFY